MACGEEQERSDKLAASLPQVNPCDTAVQDFQRRAGISLSGIVGPKTWSAMYEVIAASGGWGC